MAVDATRAPLGLSGRDATRGACAGAITTTSGTAATVVAVAAAEGGYFPVTWGWLGLGLAWALAVLLLVRPARPLDSKQLVFIGGLALLAAWSAASSLWSISPPDTVLDAQRNLLVPLAAGVAIALTSRTGPVPLLTGIWAGVVLVSAYALLTRLLPGPLNGFDPVGGYRLDEPLGYWNAVGIFSVLGVLAAVAIVNGTTPRPLRVVAAASVPLLAVATYFTFSRGAWAALAVGLLAQLGLDPARGRRTVVLLVLASAPSGAVAAAASADSLTRLEAQAGAAAADGRRVLAWLVAATLVAAFCGLLATRVSDRVAHAGRAVLGVAVCVTVIGIVALPGPTYELPARAWHAFAAPASATGNDLNHRLFSFSGGGRVAQWEAAVSQAREHPLAGQGAGTYERYWLQHRGTPAKVRDAHSLYLELLGELGGVGLVLLIGALIVPGIAAVGARRNPLVPGLFGAYVAYLAHAGIDWDWEVPAVTLTAVAIGAAMLPEAYKNTRLRRLPSSARGGAIALALGLMLVAFVALVGNLSLARADRAARAGDWSASMRYASRARTWTPWSPEPFARIGDAELALGRGSRARASYRSAIAKAPRDWSLWFDLARATRGAERQRALARAAQLNPLSPEIAQFRKELRQ